MNMNGVFFKVNCKFLWYIIFININILLLLLYKYKKLEVKKI